MVVFAFWLLLVDLTKLANRPRTQSTKSTTPPPQPPSSVEKSLVAVNSHERIYRAASVKDVTFCHLGIPLSSESSAISVGTSSIRLLQNLCFMERLLF